MHNVTRAYSADSTVAALASKAPLRRDVRQRTAGVMPGAAPSALAVFYRQHNEKYSKE